MHTDIRKMEKRIKEHPYPSNLSSFTVTWSQPRGAIHRHHTLCPNPLHWFTMRSSYPRHMAITNVWLSGWLVLQTLSFFRWCLPKVQPRLAHQVPSECVLHDRENCCMYYEPYWKEVGKEGRGQLTLNIVCPTIRTETGVFS